MLKQTDVLNAIASEDYQISLPLLSKGVNTQIAIRSSLRLLATLMRSQLAETIHVSDREVIVVISSGNCRIGFVWKMMPRGTLLLRSIMNMDEFKEAKCSVKVLSFTKSLKGVAA